MSVDQLVARSVDQWWVNRSVDRVVLSRRLAHKGFQLLAAKLGRILYLMIRMMMMRMMMVMCGVVVLT